MSDIEDLERRLFAEGRREAPAPELRARILAQRPRPSTTPAPRPARRGNTPAFAVVGALAAAAGVVFVLSVQEAAPVDVTPRAEPASPPRRQLVPSVPAPVVAPSPSTPAPVVAPSSPKAPRAAPRPAPSQPRSLAEQLELLKSARRSLRAGDARRALAVLDEYTAGSNSVDMSAEATLLRIEALQASGQRERAKALADGFVARAPDNPLADRARALTSGRAAEVGTGRESNHAEDDREKGTSH